MVAYASSLGFVGAYAGSSASLAVVPVATRVPAGLPSALLERRPDIREAEQLVRSANADVGAIDVSWIDEEDPHLNPMGVKGAGEIGIVGTAAAIANAVHDATGIRVRDLPIRLDRLLR